MNEELFKLVTKYFPTANAAQAYGFVKKVETLYTDGFEVTKDQLIKAIDDSGYTRDYVRTHKFQMVRFLFDSFRVDGSNAGMQLCSEAVDDFLKGESNVN